MMTARSLVRMTKRQKTKKLLLLVGVVCMSGMLVGAKAQSAIEQENFADVVKNDGSVARYRLMPVHYDPSHAAVVASRLEATRGLFATAPASHQIDPAVVPPVRDQGQRGTCAYFATVGLIEAHYIRHDHSIQSSLKVSEECLVDLRDWEFDQGDSFHGADKPAQRPDPNGDLPNSIILTIDQYGVPAAQKYSGGADCEYNGANANGTDVSLDQYEAVFKDGSEAYGKGLSFAQNTAPTIEAVKEIIARDIPVEIGVVVYNEDMYTSHWSYNSWLDHSFNVAGGHAIQLTGYTTDSNGKTVFTFKNSWGAAWGNSGYGTMDEDFLKNSWGYDPSFDFIASLE